MILSEKLIDIINREDLKVKPDGTIVWRSGMDAGVNDPIIGQNIIDIIVKEFNVMHEYI